MIFTIIFPLFNEKQLFHFKPYGVRFKGFLNFDDDMPRHGTARHDTETPDPGQPPLPGTKYLVRTSPHFDNNPPLGHRSEGRIILENLIFFVKVLYFGCYPSHWVSDGRSAVGRSVGGRRPVGRRSAVGRQFWEPHMGPGQGPKWITSP